MPKQINVAEDLESLSPTAVTKAPTAGKTLRVAIITPVIYTGAAGGGPNEFAGSNNPDVANVHDIPVAPAGGKVFAAFYQPLHNVAALSGFALIDARPHPSVDADIQLFVAGYTGSQTRLRIKITILFEA